MQRFLLLPILFLLSLSIYSQEHLPKGMTEAEKLIWDDYLKNYPTDKGTNPPDLRPRTPSEWDEAQGVIVTWASYQSNLREIVRYAKQVVTVYIVCSNPSSVQSYLAEGGVNTENVVFVTASYNTVWVRDYGPQSIYLNGTNELAFVDWVYNRPRPQDDAIPSVMANHLGLPIYQMTVSPNRLVATGGNFMSDGFNKGFSSNLILNENSNLTAAQIDTIVKKYMGIEPYVKMTVLPYDGIHHIDMHMKLLDEETLLVGQYPTGVADGPQIEANLSYILNNFQTPYGRPYRVVRIPMPPDESGYYPNQWSDYLTYTNSIILNNLVLVPIYGLPLDNQALQIYRDAMPGYNVVGINMRNVIPASGAIHCISKEIAANDPIFFSHPPLRDEISYSGNGYSISSHISSASGITEANLFWSLDTTAGFTQVPMSLELDTFRALIPSQAPGTSVYYYISATNGNNKTLTKPLVAPQGLYVFDIQDLGFDFSVSATSIELGDQVTFEFINQGVSAQSFLWNFGEGASPATATTQGPHTVSYQTIGTKTVALTVNGDLVLTKSDYITVTEPPVYYTLTISVEGNGTTLPEPGEHSYIADSEITASATPDIGWLFDRWEIDGSPFTNSEVSITMDQAKSAVAFFVEESIGFDFEVSLSQVEINDEVVFTFINQGVEAQEFLWNFGEGASPASANEEGPHTVIYETIGAKDVSLTINGNLTLTKPSFIIVTDSNIYYSLSISIEGNGTTTPDSGVYQHVAGSLQTLTATPDEGWLFDKWIVNDVDSSNATISLIMTQDFEAVAIFVEDQGIGFDFEVSSTDVLINEEVTFTFVNLGVNAQSYLWNFGEGASPATANTVGPHTVSYQTPGEKDISLTVNEILELVKPALISVTDPTTYYTLTVSIEGNGTTTPVSGSYEWAEGSVVSLVATPSSGWKFDQWVVNETNFSTATIQIEINQNTEAKAFFVVDGTSAKLLSQEKIFIHPNPGSNFVSISFPIELYGATLTISSATGYIVQRIPFGDAEKQVTVNVSSLPHGAYIIRVESAQGTWSSKFIKL